ncbi:MAG TPA: VOC family protein [Chryseolinea sp.]|nr:VOC family protein [Chryseolinea sp.]
MRTSFKPSGYNSVSPYLIVDGAQKMIDLLKEIFRARELRRYDGPNGTIMHVEVCIDDSVIMMADASPDYPANEFLLHVSVPDVHTTFNKAIELGCQVVERPVNKEGDPDTRGSFKDFSGNTWAVGTQKSS